MNQSGFMPNTHIETGNDRLLIGDLTPGMFVLGVKKKMARPAKVVNTYGINTDRVVCLHLANGVRLTVGPGTRVIRDCAGWTAADRIRTGHCIKTMTGNVEVDIVEKFEGKFSLIGIALDGKHDVCAEGVVCRP